MSWISDFLFGSKGEIDWKELGKMVELQAQVNRTDRQGAFTGWEWDRNADGTVGNTQTQTIDPRFQGAVDRLGFNAGAPANPYTSPSQFSTMLDAKMKNQMDRQGLDTSGYQQAPAPGETNPGAFPPAQDRPGLEPNPYLPPPPPVEAEPSPGPGPGPGPWPGGPGNTLPDDYYNDRGRARRQYRGNLYGPGENGLPPDLRNRQGNVRRKYRDEYGG